MKITRHDIPQQTNGEPPAVGHLLPKFSLLSSNKTPVTNTTLAGHYSLISVVPDINTRVCSLSTKQFNLTMDRVAPVAFYTVSTNTIAQQQDWCAAEGVHRIQLLSDEDGSFGQAMGLYIADNHTDARSVWIIDPQGVIRYRELVREQTQEPDYASALAYLETHHQ